MQEFVPHVFNSANFTLLQVNSTGCGKKSKQLKSKDSFRREGYTVPYQMLNHKKFFHFSSLSEILPIKDPQGLQLPRQ